jgi:hypothetical protein
MLARRRFNKALNNAGWNLNSAVMPVSYLGIGDIDPK